MKQKAIGEICLIRAIEYFLKKDYLVFIPISERGTADIIVDNGRNILKVQCKYHSFAFLTFVQIATIEYLSHYN